MWTHLTDLKMDKEANLHILDFTILNSIIILSSCGSKCSFWYLRLTWKKDLIQEVGRVCLASDHKTKKTSPSMSQLKRLDSSHNRHWLFQCKRIWQHVCSAKNKETKKYKCRECNIGLCATPCFKVHHTKLHFWEPNDTKMEKWNTQMQVNIAIVITELILFSSIFLMK